MKITGRDFLNVDFITGCVAVVYTTLTAAIPALHGAVEHFATPAAAGSFALAALTRWVVAVRTKEKPAE